MESFAKIYVALAACVVLGAALPVQQQYTTLKESAPEVLFKADNYSTVLLECATENNDQNVEYSWHKNGKPFDWEAAGHIGQRPGEGSIMFFNPQPTDEGIYQCFAKTSSGTASTRPIALKRTYINVPKVETKEHTPVLGRPYKFECQIPESYPKPTIVWKMQSRSDPSKVDTFLNQRITLSPDGNLWFSNITEEDVNPSSNYVCMAQTPAVKGDVPLAQHYLKSLVKSDKPNDGELEPQYLSKDVVAKAGEVTYLYCIFGGTPAGYPMDWAKDGKDVNGDEPGSRITRHSRTKGKRLMIKDTIVEDKGTYTCQVDNGVGKPQKHSIDVTVVSAPKFAQKPEKQMIVKDGQDLKIPCLVTGIPAPTITWTHNAKAVDSTAVKDGLLTIKKAKKIDTGYYGCKASNEHGDLYTETLVVVN